MISILDLYQSYLSYFEVLEFLMTFFQTKLNLKNAASYPEMHVSFAERQFMNRENSRSLSFFPQKHQKIGLRIQNSENT